MSIVIHTIYGKQYAYEHHREGNRIKTNYLYPVNSEGEKRDYQFDTGAGERFKQHKNKNKNKKPEPQKPAKPARVPLKYKTYKEYGGAAVEFKQFIGKFETALYTGKDIDQGTIDKAVKMFNKLPEYVQKNVRDLELFPNVGESFKVGDSEFRQAAHWQGFTQTIRSFDSDWNLSGGGAQNVLWHEGAHSVWGRIEAAVTYESRGLFDAFKNNTPEWIKWQKAETAAKAKYEKIKEEWDTERAALRDKWAELQAQALDMDEKARKDKTWSEQTRAEVNKLMQQANDIDIGIDKKNAEFDKVYGDIVGSITYEPYMDEFVKKADRPLWSKFMDFINATKKEKGLTGYSQSYVKAGHASAANENFAEAFAMWMPFELGLDFDEWDLTKGQKFLGDTLKLEQPKSYAAFLKLISDVVPQTKSLEEHEAENRDPKEKVIGGELPHAKSSEAS